ncbi:hypothetical protein HYU19_01365 [Candidatus Woesearchaeota archaeon]|nr:hypothetical protein [Candidatus Woesearchaeota archaeon]
MAQHHEFLLAIVVLVAGMLFLIGYQSFFPTASSAPVTGNTVSRDIIYSDLVALSKAARLDQPCVEGRRICSDKDLYACKDDKYTLVQACPIYCDRGECVECFDWVMLGPLVITPGHHNQCRGSDLYQCNKGQWDKFLSCPNGCAQQPILTDNEGKPWQPVMDEQGNELLEGHCICQYGDPDLCLNATRYKCIGWGANSSYYTRMKGDCGERGTIFA